MLAGERVYRYTNIYIIKVAVITSFVSPDVKSTIPSQHVRRYDCFPAISIKSGVWLAKRDIRTPRSPHRFPWCLGVDMWLIFVHGLKIRRKKDDSVAMLLHVLCVFRGEGSKFAMQSHFLDGWFFFVERSFFPWSSCSHASHPWVVFFDEKIQVLRRRRPKVRRKKQIKRVFWRAGRGNSRWLRLRGLGGFVWYVDNFDVKRKETI